MDGWMDGRGDYSADADGFGQGDVENGRKRVDTGWVGGGGLDR